MSTVDQVLPTVRSRLSGGARLALWRARDRRPVPLQLSVGLGIAFVLLAAALITWKIPTFNPNTEDLYHRLAGVGSPGHILGTDELGRDLLSRTFAGLRWSGSVAGCAAALVAVIGITIGVLAGSLNGLGRTILVRIVDVTMSLPGLVIAITIMAVVGRGFVPLTVTLAVVSWPIFSRVIYAEARGLMQQEYMLASRLLGVSRWRILRSHLLPGLRNTIMVMLAFGFADLLVAEAALSFLGIGAPLGAPSLGNMLSDGQEYLTQLPSLSLVPGITIVLCVTAANLVGDGIAARSRLAEREVRG